MERLRTVDLARNHGLSTQAIRNYEAVGVLPPAERTSSGYRVFDGRHTEALRAFLALVPAHGHGTAAAIMRAVNGGDVDTALALIDDGHVQLRRDRETLTAVERAVRVLARQDSAQAPAAGNGLLIGELARQLHLHAATLRKWERAGLILPQRDRRTGYRIYTTADIRDVQLVHQLRRGGYLLEQLRPIVEHTRGAGDVDALSGMLAEWRRRHTARGRAMLSAAAALAPYLPADADTAPKTWPQARR